MRSPVHQVREGQPWPAQLSIEPDTKVMQRDLGRQAGPKPAEIMGPLPVQAEGMMELLIDRLDDLADSGEPAAQRLRPRPLAGALGRTEDLRPIGLPPHRMVCLPLKALIDDIRPQGWAPHTWQPRVGLAAQGKEGVGQGWVFGAGRAKAKAGNHLDWVDGQQQVEAFIPPQTVTPADIGQPGQPAGPATLRIPRRDARAVQRFIWGSAGRPRAGPEGAHTPREHRGAGASAD